MIRGDLHGRVPDEQVSTYDISFNSGGQKKAVRVTESGILLDHIVVGSTALDTNSEVVSLNQVPIPA